MTTCLGDAGSTRVVMEGVTTFGGTLEEVEGELEGRGDVPGGRSGPEGAMRMVDGRLFVSGFFARSLGSTTRGTARRLRPARWRGRRPDRSHGVPVLAGGRRRPADRRVLDHPRRAHPAPARRGDLPGAGGGPGDGHPRAARGAPAGYRPAVAASDRTANLNIRTPFEDGVRPSISFTLWGEDGRPRSGSARARADIGAAVERGAREFVDVDFEGTIEGWDLHGSVRCRPDEAA